jgi:glycosyltransferase involved in cell wall biosynthesis
MLEKTFPGQATEVLLPGVDAAAYENVLPVDHSGPITLLSINRFSAAKNLDLAVKTLGQLGGVRLVVAGGYDPGQAEAVGVLAGLRATAAALGVEERVEFVLNPSDAQREKLLSECRCLLYTPSGEHFGFVPVEAMAAGRPVIAVNDGGPAETIVHARTGFLCEPTAEAFARAAMPLIQDAGMAREMGAAGREHVRKNFPVERFGRGLEAALLRVTEESSASRIATSSR